MSNTLESKSILLVEDNDLHNSGLADILISLDVQTTSCYTMEEARGFIIENKHDLAILDVMLPASKEDLKKLNELMIEFKELKKKIKEAMLVEDNNALVLLESAHIDMEMKLGALIDDEGGIKIAKVIRENNKINGLRPTPILFLTAVGDEEIMDKALEEISTNREWMVKPAEVQAIIDTCEKLIANNTGNSDE